MIYEFTRAEQVKIWTYDYCTVEAESFEEALKKIKDYEEDSVDCSYDYETIEQLEPTDEPTIIIYDQGDHIVYTNDSRSI